MIVLGIDPSSTAAHAWCLLDVQPRGPGRYLAHGEAVDIDELVDVVRESAPRIHLLAVESPALFIPRSKGNPGAAQQQATNLMVQQGHVGEVRRAAKDLALGAAYVELTAGQWRVRVVGVPSPEDGAIKAAVLQLVGGWPERTNEHARDAAGVALAVGWGVRPPPPVLTARSKPGPRNRVKVSMGQNGTVAK